MKQKILDWLRAGAIWKDGVLLFRAVYGRQHPFITLIKKGGSEVKYQILKQSLANYTVERASDRPKLREDFPFLKAADCPEELKILAADKLTAYYAYTDAHTHLFDCIRNEDYLNTATQVVENYLLNRLIFKEFDYYKANGSILGEHPIFRLRKRKVELKAMKIGELVKLKAKLAHNIWRINSEINKGDKAHLFEKRKADIAFKQEEILIIDRIIEPYV